MGLWTNLDFERRQFLQGSEADMKTLDLVLSEPFMLIFLGGSRFNCHVVNEQTQAAQQGQPRL